MRHWLRPGDFIRFDDGHELELEYADHAGATGTLRAPGGPGRRLALAPRRFVRLSAGAGVELLYVNGRAGTALSARFFVQGGVIVRQAAKGGE